ncbi:hypothetical protein As57867_003600, partial [Aphanomyces stellatus]
SFPSGHYYAVQNKAWMDSSVWQQYLWFVLAEGVQGKSVLVLDNFESHVSDEGKETAALLEYDVCALPPNATSHCQPFDVSIMAPFKRHMRDLWIAEDMISSGQAACDDRSGNQGLEQDYARTEFLVHCTAITPIVVENADSMEINAAQHTDKADAPENKLMIVQGAIDGKSVRIWIDCGVSNLLCRPGLAKKVIRSKEIQAEGFDGHCSGIKKWTFSDLFFTEWDLGKDFDIILGKPWFFRFNHIINWHQNRVLSVSSSEAAPEEMEGRMIKVTMEFSDVFPDKLPNELPPKRASTPFRLSKLKEYSLDKFVDDLLQKGWIELSNRYWVSNIFGVPKRSDVGQMLSRREWLRIATPDTPIRWVLDYRHVSSQSIVPKIPLPNIEDLFDRVHGSRVFTKIDLASGYHHMLVVPGAQKYTAFRTHRDVYEWVVAPMGMAGMPGIWSRLMR